MATPLKLVPLHSFFLCPRPWRTLSDTAIRPSVCPSCPMRAVVLGYRYAGCLQLSHVRSVDPSADGRKSAASRTAIGGGGISSRRPRGDNLYKLCLLYKSLFTENSVATQRQYSTSINTNKIQNTTIKSITSSFSTKLVHLLILLQNWQKPFTVEMYRTKNPDNFSCNLSKHYD